MSVNWSYDGEQIVAGALGMVPGVGSLLSALTYILWPSTDDVWQDIQQQVEALVQQDLSAYDAQQIADSLQGAQNIISQFLNVVTTDDTGYIVSAFTSANTVFLDEVPKFQDATYGIVLLPMFVQFANLHLSLLRDAVLFGSQWDLNAAAIAEIQTQLTETIASYTAYANQTYTNSFPYLTYMSKQWVAPSPAPSPPPGSGSLSLGELQFLQDNNYIRQMTGMVLDYVSLWPYFDPSTTKYPASVRLTSEIYTDPMGTAQGWVWMQGLRGQLGLPTPPTQPMQHLTIWAYNNLDAVQATYPAGCGPNGETTTPRLGDQNGGVNTPPQGGVFDVSTNPIVNVQISLYGGDPSGILLTFQDGTQATTGVFYTDSSTSFSYPGRIVSSAYVNGVGSYTSADCVFFGFQYGNQNLISMSVVETMFITLPGLNTIADLLALLPAGSVDPKLVEQTAISQNWQALRDAYWKQLTNQATAASHPQSST